MEDKDLINRLNRNPHIKARIEALLSVVENSSGEFKRADDAEDAIADGVRQIAQELLQDWAIRQNAATELAAKNNNDLKCHAKKNFTGGQHSEKLG